MTIKRTVRTRNLTGPLVQGRIVGFYPTRSGFESLAAHHASLAQGTERPTSNRQGGVRIPDDAPRPSGGTG